MKYWVFDLDGTLVDSLTIHFRVLKEVFAKFECNFSDQDEREVLHVSARTLPDYFIRHFGANNLAESLKMYTELTHQSLNQIQPFQGIESVLQTLKKYGYQLAVWTARDLEATKRILQNTGLHSYFSVCVSGTCTELAKPHPSGLEKIATHFDAEPSRMVMIGDFDSDMLGAQAFGAKSIRVLWHPTVEKKRCPLASWQFEKVSDFHSWIEGRAKTSI